MRPRLHFWPLRCSIYSVQRWRGDKEVLLRLLGVSLWIRESKKRIVLRHNKHHTVNSGFQLIEPLSELSCRLITQRSWRSTTSKQDSFSPPQDGIQREGLCFVFSLAHACLCPRECRGGEKWLCRRRKFLFVQTETQQQHSCDCRIRFHSNNTHL